MTLQSFLLLHTVARIQYSITRLDNGKTQVTENNGVLIIVVIKQGC